MRARTFLLVSHESVQGALDAKLARLGLSLKILTPGKLDRAGGCMVRQTCELQLSIAQDLARAITRLLRDMSPQLKSQVQGDAVGVTGKRNDDAPAGMAELRAEDHPMPRAQCKRDAMQKLWQGWVSPNTCIRCVGLAKTHGVIGVLPNAVLAGRRTSYAARSRRDHCADLLDRAPHLLASG
jgi:hypothetical protein